ncbi:hypothetical protein [Parasitella parasitica]|uniref:C2H2-type domain-containing protein n=1 Tax=Parasitella parasitica TaxID=35722 RepID=A0A0B7NRY3_9FUNG|nr:hypothetical protein [Parasitella parasitica]
MAVSNCPQCSKTFTSEHRLNTHRKEKHVDRAFATCYDNTELCLIRCNGHFRCLCDHSPSFETLSGFSKHVRNKTCKVIKAISFSHLLLHDTGSNEEGTFSDEEFEANHNVILPKLHIPVPNFSAEDLTMRNKRDYNNAFLNACQAADWDNREKKRLLTIMDTYDLQPIALINDGDVEYNALTHEKNLHAFKNDTMKVYPLVPKQSAFEGAKTIQTAPISLYSAISTGPPYLRQHIMYCTYIELTNDMAMFLNQDWSIHKSMRYACSRALAGSILLNESTGKALLVNCVEVFGRRRTLDAHRESFRTKNGGSMCTSIPPEDTKYKNVYPTTITDADGTKLVIGTKTFNALITSSLRLDALFNPEVGPNVMSFDLNDSSKAKTTTIFIKESAWKEAAEIAQNNNAASITSYDLIYQLRQLRTRFHQQSTYFLCRASNETVDNLAARPYTIYTLAEWDNGNDNADYRTASKLFQTIAINVIGGNPRLEKYTISSLCSELKVEGTAVHHIFQSISTQFSDDTTFITIIGNKSLNHELQKLANLLAPAITKANQSVKQAVLQAYAR